MEMLSPYKDSRKSAIYATQRKSHFFLVTILRQGGGKAVLALYYDLNRDSTV
jgi:hypothetical protein